MALDNTYAGLQASIVAFLDVNTSDLTSTIADLIVLGENRVLREARTKDNEAALSSAIAAGVLAVPTDFIAMKFAYINGTPASKLERRPAEWIYASYSTRSAQSIPKYYAREGTNFIFGPYPDSGYTVNGIYYKRAGTLSSAVYNLFTNNQDLYLFACLAESEIVIGRDSRIQIWEAKYNRILADINGLDQRDSASGTIQMRLG